MRLGADVHGLPGALDLTYSRGIASPYRRWSRVEGMSPQHKPSTSTARFVDGDLTILLTFPTEDAAQWRSATEEAILDHLGLGETDDLEPAWAGRPGGRPPRQAGSDNRDEPEID